LRKTVERLHLPKYNTDHLSHFKDIVRLFELTCAGDRLIKRYRHYRKNEWGRLSRQDVDFFGGA
jgi:hypothetical protein